MNSNSSGEEAAGAAGKAKRKDLMDNIKSRLNVGYNMKTHGKRNEKELQTKVRFFEKKMEEGKFKEFMRPRYEAAKTLLERVQALRATPLAAKAAVPAPAEPLRTLAAPALKPPAASGRTKTLKNKSKGAAAAPAALALREVAKAKERGAAAVVVPPPVPAAAAPAKSRKVRKTLAAPLSVRPAGRLGTIREANENENMESMALAALEEVEAENAGVGAPAPTYASAAKKAPKVEIQNEYLVEASQKYLPLPELYDPYTGRKFGPDESPLTPIERAYKQLKKIRRAAYRNANTLRAAAGVGSARRGRKTRRGGRRRI